MKENGIILSLLLCILLSTSCKEKRTETHEGKQKGDFIYRDSFMQEELIKTISYCSESKLINTSKSIPELLTNKWLKPLGIEGGYHNKMLAYQGTNEIYHAVLLLVVGDELPDSASFECYDTRQYLVTVKNSGDFIDGVRVQNFESGIDSLIDNVPVVMVLTTKSTFHNDTVKVFNKSLYLKETRVDDKMVLQEEFEQEDVDTYLINSDGRIVNILKKKGVPRKLSEDQIEKPVQVSIEPES